MLDPAIRCRAQTAMAIWTAVWVAAWAGAGCARLNRPDPTDTALQSHNWTAPVPPRAAHALRVATYNVHGERAATIARGLRENPQLRRADVVFLQEVETSRHGPRSTPAMVARALERSYAYAPGYGIGATGSHGVAILSRLPLRDVRAIELPRYHVVFNSARRVALTATVEVDGRPVRLYSVHLDNRVNPCDRSYQLSPVLADADRAPGVPTIIGGDMNTSPFCWIGHVVPVPCGVQDNRLEGFVRARGFATPVRDSGATSKWIGMRLDAIYTRNLDVTAFGVDDVVRVSDHLPLWADVELAPAPAQGPAAFSDEGSGAGLREDR